MRIAHNITALNAWRQLNLVNSQLGKSVERISSGYRINRAGDDPAGLVISENLRAQIVGMDQALRNTQDGISMVQTAEGALTEIHSLLDSMRSLALHAANTAGVTAEAIAADQEQLDSAIESIERIATTTAYAGKKLLDGTAGKQAEIKNTDYVSDVDVGNASVEGIVYVTVQVTNEATRAQLGSGEVDITGGVTLSSIGKLTGTTTLNINGVGVDISGGMTVTSVVTTINEQLNAENVNIQAELVAGGGTGTWNIVLRHQNYGSDYLIDLYDEKNIIVSGSATGGITQHARGEDVEGVFWYKRIDNSGYSWTKVEANGQNGLTLVGEDGTVLEGLSITLLSAANDANGGVSGGTVGIGEMSGTNGFYSNVVRLYGEALTFQVGANAGEVYKASIGNLRASQLGASVAAGGLNNLKSGGAYDLDTDPQTAIQIIDQAIADVSAERAKLGAIQTNVLESNYRNLGVTRENLQASESRIRDVDMAKEMMEFTKNQVLTQAATAMLAQANTLPQMVLTLLR